MTRLNKKGFTIVELVIVIAVIAILAAVLIPTFSGVIQEANESAAKQEAANLYKAYLAETASTGAVEGDLVIKVDDKNYVVYDNGAIGNVYSTEAEAAAVLNYNYLIVVEDSAQANGIDVHKHVDLTTPGANGGDPTEAADGKCDDCGVTIPVAPAQG